jgi:hypothetical protein
MVTSLFNTPLLDGIEATVHDGDEAHALWEDAISGYADTEPMPLGPPVKDPELADLIQTEYDLSENDIETIMGKLTD